MLRRTVVNVEGACHDLVVIIITHLKINKLSYNTQIYQGIVWYIRITLTELNYWLFSWLCSLTAASTSSTAGKR
jgi:hypothetical protein